MADNKDIHEKVVREREMREWEKKRLERSQSKHVCPQALSTVN